MENLEYLRTRSVHTAGIKDGLREFIRFSRFSEWHSGKMPQILGFVFLTIVAVPQSNFKLAWIGWAYLLALLFLASEYMLNNLADLEQDIKANKVKDSACFSRRAKVLSVVLCCVAGLGLGFAILPVKAAVAMVICYLFGWSYSFGPRFKERLALGPIVSAAAQVPSPLVVIAVAMETFSVVAFMYIVVMFLYGIRMLLVHQLIDRNNDLLTGTRTTAVVLGASKTKVILKVSFISELITTLSLVVLLAYLNYVPWFLFVPLLWPVVVLIVRYARGRLVCLDTYLYIPLGDIHESVLPVILAFAAAWVGGYDLLAASLLMVFLFLSHHYERLVAPMVRWEQSDE